MRDCFRSCRLEKNQGMTIITPWFFALVKEFYIFSRQARKLLINTAGVIAEMQIAFLVPGLYILCGVFSGR